MPYTLANHRNFDQWLTELPDEGLQYFCDAIASVLATYDIQREKGKSPSSMTWSCDP